MVKSKESSTVLVGAHMSIAGGFYKAVERAEKVGGTCMQIFTKSNQQWAAKPIEKNDADLFAHHLENSSIKQVIVHASYLINLGSCNKELHEKSVNGLLVELERCKQLGINYLVLHPGAAVGCTVEESIRNIAQGIDQAFNQFNGSTMLLLENTAGQGNVVGKTLEQLKEIYELSNHKQSIGFCIDTCHAFAAGYDFKDPKEYEKFWHTFDELFGIEKLKALHCNDSKKGLGSNTDRHEDIGKGMLGAQAFKMIMNDARFAAIPKIIETPKEGDGIADDARNIAALKSLME